MARTPPQGGAQKSPKGRRKTTATQSDHDTFSEYRIQIHYIHFLRVSVMFFHSFPHFPSIYFHKLVFVFLFLLGSLHPKAKSHCLVLHEAYIFPTETISHLTDLNELEIVLSPV